VWGKFLGNGYLQTGSLLYITSAKVKCPELTFLSWIETLCLPFGITRPPIWFQCTSSRHCGCNWSPITSRTLLLTNSGQLIRTMGTNRTFCSEIILCPFVFFGVFCQWTEKFPVIFWRLKTATSNSVFTYGSLEKRSLFQGKIIRAYFY
jgi:hypothetical protein